GFCGWALIRSGCQRPIDVVDEYVINHQVHLADGRNPWRHRFRGKAAILPPMTGPSDLSLQERFAPEGRCFGCGPANTLGLRIRSFPSHDDPEQLVAEWRPSPQHEAFSGVVNGGIIGTLLDCHSNWTAANHLMLKRVLDRPPTTVTLQYAARPRRPTP